jgi:hypothetical protein
MKHQKAKNGLSKLILPYRYAKDIQKRLAEKGEKVYSESLIQKTRRGFIENPNPKIIKELLEYSDEYKLLLHSVNESPNP